MLNNYSTAGIWDAMLAVRAFRKLKAAGDFILHYGPECFINTLLAVRSIFCRHCFYNVYFVSIRVFYHDSFRTVGHSVNNRLLVFP